MPRISRRECLASLAAAAATAAGWSGAPARAAQPAAPAAGAADDRPNVVIIVADDLGWGHVGWQGSPIRTPNLDKLASAGLRLNRHYVAPVCSPTRTGLMTGRFWSRFNVTNPETRRCLPWDTVTMASALQAAGYQTAISGKWHLGARPEWGPKKFGFQRSYGSLAGGLGPYTHLYRQGEFQKTFHREDQLVDEQGHVTDLFAAYAVERIQKAEPKPLFLYVPFTAPHFPCSEPKEWMDFNPDIADPALRLYGAAISHMDDAIGRIVKALADTGRLDKTIILFFGDNGAPGQANAGNYPGEYQALTLPGTNLPLRGKKGTTYEGGIRTPCLVHWPRGLKSGQCDLPLHVVDWLPTLARLAGYKTDKDLKWDGSDILPALQGKAPLPERTLYCKGNDGSSAVFRGEWKLITGRKGGEGKKKAKKDAADAPQTPAKTEPAERIELYNVVNDIGEKDNLAQREPARVEELKKALAEISARDGDAVAKDEPK